MIVVTAASAGTFLLIRGDGNTANAEEASPGGGAADPAVSASATDQPLLAMPTRAAPARPVPTGSGPGQAGRSRSATAVTGGPGVTPSPPRLLVIARAPVGSGTLHKIAAMRDVRKVTALGGGAVRVSGTGLNLLAVNPAEFRSWTPEAVAAQPEVWAALRRGEFVAEAASVRRLGLVLGAEYQVDGGPRLRVAASAGLGIPGVDGVVSEETGRRLGLSPGLVVLVNGPAEKVGGVSRQVGRLLGAGTQLVAIGPAGTALAAAGGSGPAASAPAQAPASTPGGSSGLVGRPATYLELYRRSAQICPGLSWTVLAAIGQVESGHGRNNGPSSAGALGPMQFMPATWKSYGVDGDGDGKADIWSPYDAVPAAAGYLCANGAGQGGKKLEKSIWFYNHSWDYVSKVMGLAAAYAAAYP
jgi:hypothetical protein